MTDIEKKALALVRAHGGQYGPALEAAIEQHEAYKREVSDAIDSSVLTPETEAHLSRFIIPKPDPLVEAWQMAFPGNHIEDARDECAKISAAIKARGGRIVWEGE